MIAMALACEPKLLIADEPTTALDVTIQAQVLDLLRSLQHELGMAVLFVTHDLGVVADIADRITVLYAGQIVEVEPVEDLFKRPRHPYSEALMASMPQVAAVGRPLDRHPGSGPAPRRVPRRMPVPPTLQSCCGRVQDRISGNGSENPVHTGWRDHTEWLHVGPR